MTMVSMVAAAMAWGAAPTQPPPVMTETVENARLEPRIRAGLGIGAAGVPGSGPGFGVVAELGVQLADRFALLARGGVMPFNGSLDAAVLGEIGIERFSVGAGAGAMVRFFGSIRGIPYAFFPVVLGVTPFGRDPASVALRGLHVWLEGDLFLESGASGFGGSLNVGFAWR
jgi:hypothetical protein